MKVSDEMIISYSNAVSKHGPDAIQAKEIREKFSDNIHFVRFADGIDNIKRVVGGSGIDYQPHN